MTLRAAWVAVALAGCVASYRPARAELSVPLADDAFARARAVVRSRYPRLVVIDPERFRIQSAWVPHQRGEVPGEKRATVFVDPPGTLNVVVEVRYLDIDLLGAPRWSGVRGDPALERELIEAVVRALRPPR